ncbi:hypothetical protein [Paractinoplanes rishiriensis]|uniref:Uncharacterized protein n=1 Tax=Paractinoplanes rishiriensis TaxID=1050105 RepID=A0A919K9A5_9ACTN|nr:hypothetical protein [Actinoplanes rishiriensis]GIE98951.1 hypothetical protein Ari01nite_64160 [Actinoplanes rishiriensis]
MSTVLIGMLPGSDYDRTTYGITHRSAHVFRVTGTGVHNRCYPHRVQVWDNTGRPNTDPGRFTEFTGRVGPGAYIDPCGKGTDTPVTVTTSAEAVAVTNNGTNTGTEASGQVYAPETIAMGDVVILVYPGGLLSEPYVLTARPLGDPRLTPLAANTVTPDLLRALNAARQFEQTAAAELAKLGEVAEETGDFRHRDERSADLGEVAWERLSDLLAHLDQVQ